MNNAPSVHYPVGRSRFFTRIGLLAWLAGSAVIGAWILQSRSYGWRQLVGSLSVLMGAAIAWRGAAKYQQGILQWTGQEWLLTADAGKQQGRIAVCLDTQFMILVRFLALQGPGRWLWLERWQAPKKWPDLRRAVYSRARVAKSAQPEPY
jgi:toxin CptA